MRRFARAAVRASVRATACVLAALTLAACADSGTPDAASANGPARTVATGTPGATAAPAAYLDNTGRTDVLGGGARMIPITTPKGTFNVWTKRVGNNPTVKVLLLHGGPGMTHEYWEAMRLVLPGRRHRVLLLRPARVVLQRPAEGLVAVEHRRASSTRSSRSAPRWASTARTSTSWATRGAGCSAIEYALEVPGASEGAHHLEHDGQHPGVQRVRGAGADAGDGPEGARGGQGARGAEGLREPALHGAADPRALPAAHPAHAARPSGPIR